MSFSILAVHCVHTRLMFRSVPPSLDACSLPACLPASGCYRSREGELRECMHAFCMGANENAKPML